VLSRRVYGDLDEFLAAVGAAETPARLS